MRSMGMLRGRPMSATRPRAGWRRDDPIQSMAREDARRTPLFDLDMASTQVNPALRRHGAGVALTCCHHNLLRLWVDA